MKTRLRTHTRDILLNYARGLIRSPEHAAREAEALAAVHALSAPFADAHFPPAEMAVFEKWNIGRVQNHVEIKITGRRDCIHAPLPSPRHFPNRYGNSCEFAVEVAADHPLILAVRAYEAAVQAHRDAKNSIFSDYATLIHDSRNYEDVVAVWPEASGVADRLGVAPVNALTRVSDDLVARIAADVASRQAAVS